MKHPSVSSQGKISAEQRKEDPPRFHGYWLVLARAVWIAFALLIDSVGEFTGPITPLTCCAVKRAQRTERPAWDAAMVR